MAVEGNFGWLVVNAINYRVEPSAWVAISELSACGDLLLCRNMFPLCCVYFCSK